MLGGGLRKSHVRPNESATDSSLSGIAACCTASLNVDAGTTVGNAATWTDFWLQLEIPLLRSDPGYNPAYDELEIFRNSANNYPATHLVIDSGLVKSFRRQRTA